MLLKDLIQNSLNEFNTIPKDNMDGSYSFPRSSKQHTKGWTWQICYISDCTVCGVACVKTKDSYINYKVRFHCSAQCNNMKAFTYEEYKSNFHKKKMPLGKYITHNGIDLAIKYKGQYAFYKDYGYKMSFWKMYDGKKSNHSPRVSTHTYIKANCIECNASFYKFKYQGSAVPTCSKKCKKKMSYKSRIKDNINTYENPKVYQMDYPTFIDEKGGRKRCHVHSMELHLGRPMKKGEVIHHIDMHKDHYDIDNLYLCNISSHQIAHGSMNELVHALIERNIVEFSKETGKYYLTTNEKENAHVSM